MFSAMKNGFRRAREERGLSQASLATLSGVSQNNISELETGANANPTWQVLSSIAFALGVTPQELLPPIRKRIPDPVRRRRAKREAA